MGNHVAETQAGAATDLSSMSVEESGLNDCTLAECCSQVRFFKGKLQQLWLLRRVDRNGYANSFAYQWRDVPEEGEEIEERGSGDSTPQLSHRGSQP